MMIAAFRRRLAWKLFLSYLIVIIIGIVVLATAAELSIPSSFQRHLAAMGSMMSTNMGEMGMGSDLFLIFRSAVNEALLLATLAAVMAAIIVSLIFSRRVVSPVEGMMAASQRIAEGHYEERVDIPGSPDPAEMDELALLAVSFNQMALRLDQTEAMRRQLIGDVAHELRTPLSTIKASIEGLIDGVLSAQIETFQQVAREVDRMGRLLEDLQELSRVEAGAYQLDRKPIRLEQVIETSRDRLARQFFDKGVSLGLSIPERLPPVLADENRVGQVLLNLVGNALQYTPTGGSVHISLERVEQELVVHIRDTGIGIPPEHLPYLFTRFYRVDKSRSRAGGGSGIGLTIAKHIVEAHQGRIWVESPGLGKGSTFSFSLPIAS